MISISEVSIHKAQREIMIKWKLTFQLFKKRPLIMNMTKASPISSPEERHVFVIPLDLSDTQEEDQVEAIPPKLMHLNISHLTRMQGKGGKTVSQTRYQSIALLQPPQVLI